MKLFKNKDEFHKSTVIFLIIAASVLFTFGVYKFGVIWRIIKKIIGFFTPFYIGFAIAYLLNPVLKLFENKIFKKMRNVKKKRALSTTLVFVFFLAVLFLLLYCILPSLISSISTLVGAIPSNVKSLTNSTQKFLSNHPQISDLYNQHSDRIAGIITQTLESVANGISSLIPSVVTMTVSITSGIADFFIGIVIAIYMLLSKEKLIAQLKKLTNYLFNSQTTERILHVSRVTNEKMSNYIVAQLSISCIDAIIVYLVSLLFDFPYPILLAVIVALFNMIPFFGSIIGCIPCVLIILIQSPLKALYFLIFFIILQQIEGNVYGPKIQGKQLNISALWIIFAILLFGGLFGFLGLLIGVPVFSVIYLFFTEAVNSGLRKKGLSDNTEDYM